MIGYGAMFPGSTAANVVVVVESIVSLPLTAMSTGLVVAKVSRPTARVMFTRHAVVSPFDGVGNAPGTAIALNAGSAYVYSLHALEAFEQFKERNGGRTMNRNAERRREIDAAISDIRDARGDPA